MGVNVTMHLYVGSQRKQRETPLGFFESRTVNRGQAQVNVNKNSTLIISSMVSLMKVSKHRAFARLCTYVRMHARAINRSSEMRFYTR